MNEIKFLEELTYIDFRPYKKDMKFGPGRMDFTKAGIKKFPVNKIGK